MKESEEAQKVLQKDCETYKKVLAETVRPGRLFHGSHCSGGKKTSGTGSTGVDIYIV